MALQIVRIRTETWEQLRDLQRVYDVDVFRQTAKQLADHLYEIQGLLSDEEIKRLSEKGYQIETIADAEEIAKARTNQVSRPPSSPKRTPDEH